MAAAASFITSNNHTLPRPTRVKNKTPAPIQITAEQILRETREGHGGDARPPPKHKIADPSELSDYGLCRRKEFEDALRIPRARRDSGLWIRYAQWEASQNDFARARSIWERALHQNYRNHTLWLKYADFEMKNKFVNHARNVLDRAVTLLPRVNRLWVSYIRMEETLGNDAGARQVYARWMAWMPVHFYADESEQQQQQHRDNQTATTEDDAILVMRRSQYEEQLRCNPLCYNTWFDLIRLEESVGSIARTREVYERAIANVPPAQEKRYWRRYIYLWIGYALLEEIDAEDVPRTREVYRKCLRLIPHQRFSFSKIWIMAAQFEIRQKNLQSARKLLGNAIGRCPSDKIFKKYIEIELQLGNISRVRTLYERHLKWAPQKCCVWRNYAELERTLNETERARAIFELALAQPSLDAPESLWKEYTDFELGVGNNLPNKLKRRRQIVTNADPDDYAFPQETALAAPHLKILDAAYNWKKQKLGHAEE